MDSESKYRINACIELTKKFQSQKSFSYLRLGDGELKWILDFQEGKDLKHHQKEYTYNKYESITKVFGVRGVKEEDYHRLINAYENCDYLDLYQKYPYNRENIKFLKVNISPLTYTTSIENSKLIFEWAYFEFKKFIAERRCLFVCAEASLLEQLYQDTRYRKIAKDFWPNNSEVFFLQVRNDGRHYWDYLEEIKNDIRRIIIEKQVDTLFLSLGTGAKILCYELANELEICAIDSGALSRGLSFAGSPGYHSARSTHTPYYFRVPFEIYMDSLKKAYPEINVVDILAKAHAQLCLELQRKIPADSTAADTFGNDSFDPTPENLRNFWQSYEECKRKYYPLAKTEIQAQKAIQDFARYRYSHNIGMDSYLFNAFASSKKALKRLLTVAK
jgi:hypothetical protein